eukprot:3298890-Rhodomonas_salina.7
MCASSGVPPDKAEAQPGLITGRTPFGAKITDINGVEGELTNLANSPCQDQLCDGYQGYLEWTPSPYQVRQRALRSILATQRLDRCRGADVGAGLGVRVDGRVPLGGGRPRARVLADVLQGDGAPLHLEPPERGLLRRNRAPLPDQLAPGASRSAMQVCAQTFAVRVFGVCEHAGVLFLRAGGDVGGGGWQLWYLNPGIGHPDFSLSILQRSINVGRVYLARWDDTVSAVSPCSCDFACDAEA